MENEFTDQNGPKRQYPAVSLGLCFLLSGVCNNTTFICLVYPTKYHGWFGGLGSIVIVGFDIL